MNVTFAIIETLSQILSSETWESEGSATTKFSSTCASRTPCISYYFLRHVFVIYVEAQVEIPKIIAGLVVFGDIEFPPD
jgi:hypothetical protein